MRPECKVIAPKAGLASETVILFCSGDSRRTMPTKTRI